MKSPSSTKTHLNRKLGFMVCSSSLLCLIFLLSRDSQNTAYSEMDWKTNDKSYQKRTVSCDLRAYSACVQQEEVTTRGAPAARPCSVSPCRNRRHTDSCFASAREVFRSKLAALLPNGYGTITLRPSATSPAMSLRMSYTAVSWNKNGVAAKSRNLLFLPRKPSRAKTWDDYLIALLTTSYPENVNMQA